MFRKILIGAALFLLFITMACSNGQDISPTDPSSGDSISNAYAPNSMLTTAGVQEAAAGRYLWGYWDMYWDPETQELTAVPVRDTQVHINILRFLEDTLCETCLVIGDNEFNVDGDLEVEIGIIHPIDYDGKYVQEVFTGFDVRGIAIFEGTYYFDENGVKISYEPNDEYTLVDPDGYTRLWSPAEFPPDPVDGRPIFEYYPAKYEVDGIDMTTTLNPYMAFFTMAERRVFESAGHDERIFTIRFPGDPFSVPLKFGYAVDTSWAKPANIDAPEVPEDFPMNANSWEAYRLMAVVGGELTPLGGSVDLILRIYDWQGADTIESVTLEAPDLFNGLITADFVQVYQTYTEYGATITNELGAVIGTYPVLCAIADVNPIPVIGKIDGYDIIWVDVLPPLELLGTVELEHDPIEGNFNPENDSCYFAPLVGVDGKEIQGLDPDYDVINGFPPVLSTGGMGLCVNTQEIFLATDTGADDWEEDVTVYAIASKDEKWTISIPSDFGNDGSTPIDFAVYEPYNEVWVSLYSDNQIAVFPANNETPVMTRVGIGTGPTTLYIDPPSYRIYAACDGNDKISIIDGFTRELADTIDLENPLESPDPLLPATIGMAVVPSLNMLFIATLLNGTVDYYDLETLDYEGSVVLSSGTEIVIGLVYDPGADVLLATCFGTTGPGQLFAIDPNMKEILYQTDTSGMNPSFPGLDTDNHILYVPDPMGIVDIFKIIV